MNCFVRLDSMVGDNAVQFELLSVGMLLQAAVPFATPQRDPEHDERCSTSSLVRSFADPEDADPINFPPLPTTPHPGGGPPFDESVQSRVHSRMDPTCLKDMELLGKGSFARVWKAQYTKGAHHPPFLVLSLVFPPSPLRAPRVNPIQTAFCQGFVPRM